VSDDWTDEATLGEFVKGEQQPTLRDRFAMAALASVTLNLQGTEHAGDILKVIARDCYDMADAMVEARATSGRK
jgi:hypothetical protein